MTHDTGIALFLLEQLIAALQANDPDTFNRRCKPYCVDFLYQLLTGTSCSGLLPQVERVGTAKASLLVQSIIALQAMKLFAL